MATWTTIADARLEPDKPARSIDAIALRDNPVAIAENAPNAPKVEQYYLLITTSTTWTVPKTGQYWVDLIGGGGGGGAGTGGGGANGGGGGGSGYVASKMLTLTQGDTYPIVIGIAGSGGSGGNGAGGAATTGFGLSAAGGGGGSSGAGAGVGGAGHSSGRNGSAGASSAGGKGGSAPILVPDINATDGAGASGSGGFGYGAGGGGGSANVGGAGAQGAVIIRGI